MSMDKRIQLPQLAQAMIEQERQRDDVAFVKDQLMRKKQLSEPAAFKKITERARELGCGREEAARIMRREMEEIT